MTSFPAAALRVRDESLPEYERLLHLRECALRCAPYGFRATWHYLIVNAGIPQRLEDDPAALNRAVDELSAARAIWRRQAAGFAAERRAAKARGQRAVPRRDRWQQHGVFGIAFCPDPLRHPVDPLPVILRRLIEVYGAGTLVDSECPLCGERLRRKICATCGIQPRGHDGGVRLAEAARTRYLWREIWRRTPMTGFSPPMLAALRNARRLATEVPASGPGRRAFVDIVPGRTDADRIAEQEGWVRSDPSRPYEVRHWDYDERLLDTFDYDLGAVRIATASARGNVDLLSLLADWGLTPTQFDHPWNTADPR
ncbi:hypothetical protein AB0D32_20185 [Micromonospora sp. NPDC048170]|uniref:hypothetical protein n=1 Tax=Micromonospora sp. NPDC048170 TaxID=3154819 RepID=UPI0033CD3149